MYDFFFLPLWCNLLLKYETGLHNCKLLFYGFPFLGKHKNYNAQGVFVERVFREKIKEKGRGCE